MTKNQFRQKTKSLGFEAKYSGHTKTFYLSGSNLMNYEECLEMGDFRGFRTVYQ